jgi:hypothetical protein
MAIGRAAAASESPPALLIAATDASPIREFLKNFAIFLVLAVAGGYVWYFGLFPRLLRKKHPNWPLDAWRNASYGCWLTVCGSAYVFRRQFVEYVLDPLGRRFNANPTLIAWLPEVVVLPLVALVGLLVIWNFRREETNRVRPVEHHSPAASSP